MKKKVTNYFKASLLLFLSIITQSCNKNQIGPQGHLPSDNTIIENSTSGFFVINEGNFGSGNASLSYINLTESSVTNDYYYSVNGNPMGDVFQSMSKIDDHYFLVLNNSQKIVVVDTTFHWVSTLDGFTSPRYIARVAENKAYVSDLYADQISVIDLTTYEITSTIDVGGWTEEITVVGSSIFVQERENSKLLVIDPNTDQIINEVQLSEGISNTVVANDSSLWVLCDGGYVAPINATLYHIDSQTNTIIASFDFNSDVPSPRFLCYNSTANELYFYQDGVRQMSVGATELPTQVYLEPPIDQIYGMDFDQNTHSLVLMDAKDYATPGTVYLYSQEGVLLNNYDVGLIPNGIFSAN